MAHSISAKKRIRQNETRRMRNQVRTSALKTEVKKYLKLIQQREVDAAGEELKRVYKTLDQVAAKGTIHANTAARRKARLAKRFQALKAAQTA
ncbi:MAG: 30S ribosomal protein S20 [Phycisphaerae bacterium]|nr:30S ribosomal protein S20 [Phycisphaerae bacterium]